LRLKWAQALTFRNDPQASPNWQKAQIANEKSYQRLNRLGLACLGQAVPRTQEFVLMLRRPLEDELTNASGCLTLDYSHRGQADHQLRIVIVGVKVRCEFSYEQHPNHDPVKF
jgi:hypothetical protein